jgi:MFS family permease
MKLYYGWVIVSAGLIMTSIGMGSMMSLGVFMQPISLDMGWSRSGISVAAVLNFLAMGLGSFAWGSLSDRFGTRAIVLSGGLLLGSALLAASRASSLTGFQLLFGIFVGLAAGSFYAPMIATTTRWFTKHRSLAVALVSSGLGLGALLIAPLAGSIITSSGWRAAMADLAVLAWLAILPIALLVRRPPKAQGGDSAAAAESGELTIGQVLRTPQFAAIALTPFHLLRRAFGSDLPYGKLRDRLRRAGNDRRHRLRHVWPCRTQRACPVRGDCRSGRRQTHTRRRAEYAGACRVPLLGHPRQHRVLCTFDAIRSLLWRRDAALRDLGT